MDRVAIDFDRFIVAESGTLAGGKSALWFVFTFYFDFILILAGRLNRRFILICGIFMASPYSKYCADCAAFIVVAGVKLEE